jgi:N utilization substance protein B
MASSKPPRGTRARTLARKLALQALYQWQLNALSAGDVVKQFLADEESRGADADYFEEIVTTCIAQQPAYSALIEPALDRPVAQLDPVERAILWIGVFELRERVDVPYRVAINEGVELAKRFGATEAHKYVNAVLDKLARTLRSSEKG